MIALVGAYAKNRVIGNKGIMPWKIPGEQKRFKELTTGKIVVMGRKTFDEIGKPLPNRTTYLVTRSATYHYDNLVIVSSLKEAVKMAGDRDIFIAGGAKLYEEALSIVDTMYITVVEQEYEGDTFFPPFDKEDFIKVWEERHEGEVPFTFYTYERRKNL